MKEFEERGYTQYRLPHGKPGDELWQKAVDVGEETFAINAYVFHPSNYNRHRTVEFEVQNDDIDKPLRIKAFGYRLDEMGDREFKRVEEKLRNMMIYSEYA